jgi:hypothetical protein
MQAQAATVAAKITGATLQASTSISRVTLILGTDGRAVTGAASGTTTPTGSVSGTPSGVTNAADSGKCIN